MHKQTKLSLILGILMGVTTFIFYNNFWNLDVKMSEELLSVVTKGVLIFIPIISISVICHMLIENFDNDKEDQDNE